MLRRMLTAAAASSVMLAGASAALAPPAIAAPAPRTAVPVLHVHQAYLRALRHPQRAPVTGVVYGRGRRPMPGGPAGHPATSACREPNCPELYHDGPVQPTPHVYLVLWGGQWATKTAEKATATWLANFYQGLGTAPDDTWSRVTSQYGGTNGKPAFGTTVYSGTYADPSKPPKGVTPMQLAAEAEAAAAALKITDLTDAQLVIATQSGTCPAGFDASCNGTSGYYCGWNSETAAGIPFTNLPYLLNAGKNCGSGIVPDTDPGYDGFSIVGGAEYADTVTDPLGSGWYDQFGSNAEAADKCSWTNPVTGNADIGLVTLSTGVFAMQPVFSNAARTKYHDGCVMAPGQDTVSLSNPGTLTTPAGVSVSGQLLGTSSGGDPLTWSASGLPPGVSLSASSGQLSGTATTPATYPVTTTATDKTGASGETVFDWVVTNGQPIPGFDGKCLDDSGGVTTDGNKIDISTCTGTSAQLWSLRHDGTLHLALGKCLTDPGTGGALTGLVLSTCVGGSTQKWSVQANREFTLQANGLCLTDPASSTTDGTQVEVQACTAAADQLWSLP